MKAIKEVMRKDNEPYHVPRSVQNLIPIKRIWADGIFLAGTRYTKTFKFTDINYMVASEAAQRKMFLNYAALVNSLDCGATTKITVNNRHLNRRNFEESVLMGTEWDGLDHFREEYNGVIMDKATAGNGIIQEKYVTVSVCKKNISEARAYFTRVGAELSARFAALGAKAVELDAGERLRILHDFYRSGEEVNFHFDMQDMVKKGPGLLVFGGNWLPSSRPTIRRMMSFISSSDAGRVATSWPSRMTVISSEIRLISAILWEI